MPLENCPFASHGARRIAYPFEGSLGRHLLWDVGEDEMSERETL